MLDMSSRCFFLKSNSLVYLICEVVVKMHSFKIEDLNTLLTRAACVTRAIHDTRAARVSVVCIHRSPVRKLVMGVNFIDTT